MNQSFQSKQVQISNPNLSRLSNPVGHQAIHWSVQQSNMLQPLLLTQQRGIVHCTHLSGSHWVAPPIRWHPAYQMIAGKACLGKTGHVSTSDPLLPTSVRFQLAWTNFWFVVTQHDSLKVMSGKKCWLPSKWLSYLYVSGNGKLCVVCVEMVTTMVSSPCVSDCPSICYNHLGLYVPLQIAVW